MAAAGINQTAIDVFSHYYRQLEEGVTGFIAEDTIEPLTDPDLLADVDGADEQAAAAGSPRRWSSSSTAGLGTSMGMDKAKSLLPVRDGKSFLDLIVEQVLSARGSVRRQAAADVHEQLPHPRRHAGGAGRATPTSRSTASAWTSCRATSRSCAPTT